MAKFCKNCGKQLEDGEVCSCMSEAKVNVEEPSTNDVKPENNTVNTETVQNQGNSKVNDIKGKAMGYIETLKAFIKKPIAIGKKIVNACDVKNSYIFIGVQAVLVGLLTSIFAGKINSPLEENAITDNMTFSIPMVFIVSAVAAVIMAFAFAGILMLITKLFKGNTDFKYMTCVAGVNSLVLTPFNALSCVLALLMKMNIDADKPMEVLAPFLYPLLISSVGVLLGFFIVLSVINAGTDIKIDFTPYVVFVSVIILAIVYWFVFKTAFQMVLPEDIKDGIDSAGSFLRML